MSTSGQSGVVRSVEQAEYDARWAGDDYSAEQIGYTPHFLKFMSRWVASLKTGKPDIEALEVGSGNGFFSGQLAELGCKVRGLDLSQVGVERARQRYPKATFQVHDLAQPLPSDANSCDLVWCSEVLEHLFSPLSVLAEIHRVLRPGGLLLCTVPYHGLLKNLGIALFAFDRHYDPTYPHIRFFTVRTLTELIRRAGLLTEEVSTCGSGLGLRDWLAPTNILVAARKPA